MTTNSISQETAHSIAQGWYKGACGPDSKVRIELTPSGDGWLARAVAEPKPAKALPLLRVNARGGVSVIGG